MPEIYVKEFFAIAVLSGKPKITKIKQEKSKKPYSQGSDFYKQLRDAILLSHIQGLGSQPILDAVKFCRVPRRQAHYNIFANAYIQWTKSNVISNFSRPQKQIVPNGGMSIVVNPEVLCNLNGSRSLIKLYFNKKPMTQTRGNYILHLMQVAYGTQVRPVILDVRIGNIIVFSGNEAYFKRACQAEAEFIARVWTELDSGKGGTTIDF